MCLPRETEEQIRMVLEHSPSTEMLEHMRQYPDCPACKEEKAHPICSHCGSIEHESGMCPGGF